MLMILTQDTLAPGRTRPHATLWTHRWKDPAKQQRDQLHTRKLTPPSHPTSTAHRNQPNPCPQKHPTLGHIRTLAESQPRSTACAPKHSINSSHPSGTFTPMTAPPTAERAPAPPQIWDGSDRPASHGTWQGGGCNSRLLLLQHNRRHHNKQHDNP